MDVSTRPDPARLTGVWQAGSVPTAELQKLEAFAGSTLDQVSTLLQQQSPDAKAVQDAMDNLKALRDITASANPQLPATPPDSRVYAGRQEVGSPSGFQWLMRYYYNVTSYKWQEGDRVNGDVETLRSSADSLLPKVQQSFATPGPLSAEQVQTGVQHEHKQVGSHTETHGWGPFKTTTTVPDYQDTDVPVMGPAEPAIDTLIQNLRTSAHDLTVVGSQINTGGTHLQTSQYQDTEDQDLHAGL